MNLLFSYYRDLHIDLKMLVLIKLLSIENNIMRIIIQFNIAIILLILLQACSAPGATSSNKRATIDNMRQVVLSEIYKLKPGVRKKVNAASGYAVFSNVNVNLVFFSAGSGFGVVTKNANGHKTYMKMGEAGIGIGAGVKDFRALFIFKEQSVLNRFINSGWQFGAHADAAAKAGDKGAAVGGEALADGIEIYQLTENGVALQATVKGTKYWVDDSLN